MTKGMLMVLFALLTFGMTAVQAAQGSGPTRYADLTVADSTATNSYVPIYGLYMDDPQKSQTIYPADLLTAMVGETIASLKYYSTDATKSWNSTVTVSIGVTELANLSEGWSTDELTPIYTGTLSVEESVMEVIFETPFTYEGGNLIVMFDSPQDGMNYTSNTFKGMSSFIGASRTIYGSSYASGPGTVRDFIPKTTFSYGEPPTCPKPINLAVSNIETTFAELSWTDQAEAGLWNIAYWTSENDTAIVETSENPFLLENLSANTAYSWTVQAVCSEEDMSQWSNSFSFRTACGIQGIPFFDDFDSYASGFGNLPNCWSFLNLSESSSSYPQAYVYTSSMYAVSGNCLYFKSSSTTPVYAILPQITGDIETMMLSFWYRNEGVTANNGTLSVGVMTDPNDESTFYELQVYEKTTTKTEVELALSAVSGSDYYIVFKYSGGSSNNYYLGIDNVRVNEIPSCAKPQSLTSEDVTAYSATLGWTEVGTANTWTIQYGETGFTLGEGTELTVTENPFALTELLPATTYQFYVKAVCGEGDESEWSNPSVFTTECATFTMPFAENFESTTYPPNCWEKLSGIAFDTITPTSTTSGWSRVTTNNGIEGPHVKVNIYGTSCKYWLVTPPIAIEPNSALLFDMAFTDYGNGNPIESMSDDDKFMVIVSTDNGATWLEENAIIWDAAALAAVSNTATPAVINLAQYSGEIMIAFYGESTVSGGDNDFHIGNIQITEAPSCFAPYALTATPSNYSAILNWINGGEETAWNIAYDTMPIVDFSTATIVEVTEPSFTLTDLTPSTTYYAYIQAVCDEGNESEWSNVAMFTTLVACPVPTNIDVFPSTTSAELSWTEAGSATTWTIQYGETGFVLGEGTELTVTENPFTLTELLPATTYQFYIKAVCGEGDESEWSNTSTFTTACIAFNVPFVEGFEGEDFPPICWTTEHIAGSGTAVWQRNISTTYVHTGTASAKLPDQQVGNITILATAPLVIPEANAYQITFWMYRSNYTTIKPNEGIKVWANNSPDTIGGTELLYVRRQYTLEPIVPEIGWYEYSAIIPQSGDLYIVFEGISEYGQASYIDDVTVDIIPSCAKPQSLTSEDVTAYSATLSWTEAGTATTWTIQYGETGFVLGEGTELTVTENPFTLTELSPATTYQFYVKAVCGEGDESEWSNPSAFTTECATFMMPFAENFESTTYPPNCWEKLSGIAFDTIAPISTTAGWSRVTTNNGIEGPHVKVNIYGTSCKYWLVTPPIAIEPNSALLFDMAFTDYGNGDPIESMSDDDKFMVIVSTDNGATWLEENAIIWDAAALAAVSNTATPAVINLAQYSGEIMIAFYGESTVSGGDNDFHIGNIQITEAPSCFAPYALTATPNNYSAIFNWINGGEETAWNIAYDTMPIVDFSTATIVEVTEPSFTLTGLTPSTTYYAYIQAVCGEGDESAWSNVAMFTTLVACPVPTNIVIVPSTTSAELSWTPGSTETSWNLEWGFLGFEQGTGTLVNITDNPYTLSDLTPTTAYSFYLQAVCDEIETSEWMGPFNFNTLVECPEGTTSLSGTIGDGTTGTYAIPMNTFYNHSYTQQIFTAEELEAQGLTSGSINTFAFQYTHATPITKDSITIYIANTDQEVFAANGWIPITSLEEVYAGSLTMDNTGTDYWFEVQLQTPFEYDGVSNLVVAVLNNHGSYENSQMRFLTHATTDNKSIRGQVDGTVSINFDENGMPQTASALPGTADDLRNNMRFNMCAAPIACQRPTGLAATNMPEATAVLLTWNGPENATGYNVFFNGMDVTSFVSGYIQGTTMTIPYFLLQMMPADEYCVVLQTVCSETETSAMSTPLCIPNPIPQTCPTPTLYGELMDSTILLSWNTVEGATLYTVYYGNFALQTTTDTAIAITGAHPGETWCMTITATCEAGEGNHSNEVCLTIPTPCLPPTNTLATVDGTSITVTWEAPEGSAEVTGYGIFPVSGGAPVFVGADVFTYTFTDLAAGQHCYIVFTQCGEEEVDGIEACGIVEAVTCGTPENLTVEGHIVASTITLRWDAVPDAISYNIYANGEQAATNWPNTLAVFTDVEPNIEFCFEIQAVCAEGAGLLCDPVCITLPTPPTCDTPTNVVATANNENDITITWDYEEPIPGDMATIILEANDVWGDGTGYQILFDADHNTSANITGNFTCGQSYAEYEYMIPANATAADDYVVVSGSETIQIPAGVYDYVVLNPGCGSFGTVYVASDQCDASVGSSVTFEAGQTYHFTATLQGQNDCITITNTAKTREDVTFNVFLDGVMIAADLTEKTYVHEDLVNGTYCYSVTAVCANGVESDPSEEGCAVIQTSIDEQNNAFKVSPNPANTKVTVEGENIESISIYNVLGQRVANIKVEGSKSHNINTIAYESGVYLLRIVTTDGSVSTQRVVIAH